MELGSARGSAKGEAKGETKRGAVARTSAAAVRRRLRAATLTLGIAPLFWLCWLGASDDLGANPVETLTHATGSWALRFLMLCLAVTPVRRLTGYRPLQLERRTLGLFSFFYALLHGSIYVSLDLGFDLALVAEDVLERPYITVGFATFVILCTLASTSNRRATRRLGRRWKTLHRLVYAAGIGAVVHFWWLVKADVREPAIYATVLAALFGLRLWWALAASTRRGAAPG